jgi:ubiquinone/menaquinone biosynthesis C-methylase UbiE
VASYLARFAPELRVWALDISPGMAEQVRENAERAGLAGRIVTETADMRSLPYPDDSFDLVVSQYALHHLPDYETALAEMARVAGPEGAIFVRDLIRPRRRATVELLVGVFGTLLGYDAAAREQYRDSLLAGFSWDDVASCAGRLGLRASRRSLSHFVMMRRLS